LNENVEEIEELARSAGYRVVYEIIQRRTRPDPTTFLGKGKIDEVKEALVARPVDALIINGDLKPTHHYILENSLKVECVDRIRLVLEIFTLRANNKESRLQVERARLKYEIPLLREWIHSAKMGEHPGFLGGGEYAVDVYYDLIKKRMSKIDEELVRQGESNDQKRIQRKRKGFNLVSLAGYTNAGKSSLMRCLTGEEVLIEDRMFSTLSTTTKSLKGTDLPVLLTDSSDDWSEIERKLSTSERILFPEVEMDRIYLVLNKMDKLNQDQDGKKYLLIRIGERWQSSHIYVTSALTGEGIENLLKSILIMFSRRVPFELVLPQTGETETFINWLRRRTSISKLDYANDVRIIGRCDEVDVKRIRDKVNGLKGSIINLGDRN
jgi:GTP-binding protein HflX